MSTIIIALAILVFIALVVALLMYVNERDKRRDAMEKLNDSSSGDM